MKSLAQRSHKEELLDQPGIEPEDLFRNLRELEVINHWLGGHRATIAGIKELLKDKKGHYSILDVGCGGGDVFQPLLKWARKRDLQLEMKGIDLLPEAIEQARKQFEGEEKVSFEVGDLKELDEKGEQYDIVTCSLLFHHLYGETLKTCLQDMYALSRIGVVINDIHRHSLALYGISFLTSLFSKSYLVKNDAALSVRKAFVKEDLEDLMGEAAISEYRIDWFWAFRYLVLIHKK